MRYLTIISSIVFFSALSLSAQEVEQDTGQWSVDLPNMVFTAQYKPTEERNALHNVQTISAAVIERRGAQNLEQLLSQETSIRISQDAILGSSLTMQGSGGQNIKIMIDGVPLIGRQGGNLDLSQINLDNIERIEIIEGPMSVRYGTDALAGVINLISKRSQKERYKLGIGTQQETKGEDNYFANLGLKLSDQLLIQASGSNRSFEGFNSGANAQDSSRNVVWNPKERKFVQGAVRYVLKNGQVLRYSLDHFSETVIDLGEIRRPQYKPYAFDSYFTTERFNQTLTQQGDVGQFYLQSTLGWSQFDRTTSLERMDFDADTSGVVVDGRDTTQFKALNFQSALGSQFDGPINFQVGYDGRLDRAYGARIVDSTASNSNFIDIQDHAVFGSIRYQVNEDLLVESGLRWIYNTRYNAPIIPSLSAKYSLGDQWVFRASFGAGFRSPDIKELFHSFIDINHFIVGNSNLKAEQSQNFQVSARYNKRYDNASVEWKLSAFYNTIEDKIDLFEFVNTPSGIQPAVDTSTRQFTYFNQSNFKTRGFSSRIGYTRGAWSIKANLNMIGYFNPLSDTLTDVSAFSNTYELGGEATYMFSKQKASISLFVRKNDRLITYYPVTSVDDKGNETTISAQRIQDGFTLLDFTANKKFWKNKLSLNGGVRNILNVQTVNIQGGAGGVHSSGSGAAPVGTGRNLFLRVALDISGK